MSKSMQNFGKWGAILIAARGRATQKPLWCHSCPWL
jgi:hypothetical protein